MIAYRLFYLLHSSKISQCGSACFGCRNAGGDLFVGGHLHVRLKFVIQLAFNLLFSEEIGQNTACPGEKSHASPLGGCLQRIGHRQSDGLPLLGFHIQLSLSRLGKPVELRAAIVFRIAPERAQPARFLHAVKGRKQRTGLDQESSSRDLFNAPGNAQAVKFSWPQRLEDEQIERALQEICFLGLIGIYPIGRLYECDVIRIDCQ